jgi:rod shape determining protein RodA
MATRPSVLQVPSVEPHRGFGAEVGEYLRHLDYLLLAAVAGLVAYGLWIVQTVTHDDQIGDPGYFVVRQAIFVVVGVVAFAAASAVNPELYRRLRWPLYVALIVLLVGVLVAAPPIRDSRRWFDLGAFQFQPSELGKLIMVIVLSAFVANRAKRASELGTVLGAVGLVAVPAVLVFVEPDFGTALVYCAALAGVLWFGGIRWPYLAALAIVAAAVSVAVLWILPSSGVHVLKDYQVDRLTGFLDPSADPSGTTYNANQAITAVGAGGLDGRGVVGATQTRGNYLPEHSTDFIFASLSEQRGFLGAAVLLLLYAIVVWRGIRIVATADSLYTSTVAGAIVATFLFQVFLNVGMNIGIAPITGIPLPFVSYGGSSMITSLALVGVLQAIHARGQLAGRRWL